MPNHLQSSGWTIIYSDKDTGQKMLNKFGLEERAKNNPAFTAKSGQLRLVVTRQELPEKDKCQLILHETGHILLEHNISDLSDDEEWEADKFTTICKLVYKLWDYRWWISAVCAAIILLILSRLFSTVPTNCEHCLHYK